MPSATQSADQKSVIAIETFRLCGGKFALRLESGAAEAARQGREGQVRFLK